MALNNQLEFICHETNNQPTKNFFRFESLTGIFDNFSNPTLISLFPLW